MSIRTAVRGLLFTAAIGVYAAHVEASESHQTYIVALPTDFSGDVDAIKTALNRTALSQRPGTSLWVVNTTTLQTISSVTIPNEGAFANQNVLIGRVAPAVNRAREFVDRYGHLPSPPPPIASQILFPELLDQIGKNIAPQGDDRDVRVLVVGSARYSAPREPSFSMNQGLWPGDGLIMAPEASSPYGTANRHGLLNNTAVHFCITEGPNDWPPLQRDGAERAWTLFVSEIGGRLATFSSDLPACVTRFLNNDAPVKTFTLDSNDSALVMKGGERAAGVYIQKTSPPTTPPPAQRSGLFDETKIETRPPTTFTGLWTIGASWNDPIDLDLHVRCSPAYPFVNFRNMRSLEAKFPYDFRQATGAEETVEIIRPSDIRHCDVWLNYYEGNVTAPRGVIRVRSNDKRLVWEWQFAFPQAATSGNRAAGFPPQGNPGPQWLRVPIEEVLKLKSAARAPRPRR